MADPATMQLADATKETTEPIYVYIKEHFMVYVII